MRCESLLETSRARWEEMSFGARKNQQKPETTYQPVLYSNELERKGGAEVPGCSAMGLYCRSGGRPVGVALPETTGSASA